MCDDATVIATAESSSRQQATERRLPAVFASAGDEERTRRVGDAATFFVASLLVAAAAHQHEDPTSLAATFTRLLRELPDWVITLLGGVFALASLFAAFLIVTAVVARDRLGLVRDLVAAVVGAVIVGSVTGELVTGHWPEWEGVLNGAGTHFPVLRLAVVTAVVMTAAPHVVRPVRRLGVIAVLFAAIGAIAMGFGSLAAVVGGFGVGLGVAALVHLAWGSPAGAPSRFRVRSELLRLGLEVGEFTEIPEGRGVLRLGCTAIDGRQLDVKVYGRDAADTQLLARAWRFLWYRHGGGSLSVTRSQQVEHEALLLLLAERAGVTTADLVATGATASGDQLLVVTPPFAGQVVPLGEEHLESMWSQIDALGAAHIAHGRIDAEHVLAGPDGTTAIVDWASAGVEVTDNRLQSDAAASLSLTATVVGVDRAVELARRHAGDPRLVPAMAYLQAVSFTPALRKRVKETTVDLDALRAAVAAASGTPVPELEKLERVKWTSLVMTAVTLAAVWFVIGQIADIGWSTIQESFRGATWGWILLALVVGQLPRFSDAITVLGACNQPLPYGPTVALEMSISFINLAVPSTAARVALEVRYFQKQGVATAQALTFGALSSVSLFITQLAILIVTVGFGLTSLDFSLDTGSMAGTAEKLLALSAIAVVAGLLVVAVVRRLRQWVVHLLTQALDALHGIGSIRRWGPLFGGSLLGQILFPLALGLCVEAFGYHVSLVNLMAINVMVSFFAGMMPVPGGIGVTEAALTAGLVAAGVPETAALSAVLIYRMITYYLPPVWGWFTLRWLRQHEYL